MHFEVLRNHIIGSSMEKKSVMANKMLKQATSTHYPSNRPCAATGKFTSCLFLFCSHRSIKKPALTSMHSAWASHEPKTCPRILYNAQSATLTCAGAGRLFEMCCILNKLGACSSLAWGKETNSPCPTVSRTQPNRAAQIFAHKIADTSPCSAQPEHLADHVANVHQHSCLHWPSDWICSTDVPYGTFTTALVWCKSTVLVQHKVRTAVTEGDWSTSVMWKEHNPDRLKFWKPPIWSYLIF